MATDIVSSEIETLKYRVEELTKENAELKRQNTKLCQAEQTAKKSAANAKKLLHQIVDQMVEGL